MAPSYEALAEPETLPPDGDQLPETGQIVHVRARRYLVESVESESVVPDTSSIWDLEHGQLFRIDDQDVGVGQRRRRFLADAAFAVEGAVRDGARRVDVERPDQGITRRYNGVPAREGSGGVTPKRPPSPPRARSRHFAY